MEQYLNKPISSRQIMDGLGIQHFNLVRFLK